MSKGGSSTNDSTQRFSRALMLPQEIQRMASTKELIFKKGGKVNPIFCDKIIYYTDPFFAGRIELPVGEIPDMIFPAEKPVASKPVSESVVVESDLEPDLPKADELQPAANG